MGNVYPVGHFNYASGGVNGDISCFLFLVSNSIIAIDIWDFVL
jgi:hypothetical protein